jgi:hypothetical protein
MLVQGSNGCPEVTGEFGEFRHLPKKLFGL